MFRRTQPVGVSLKVSLEASARRWSPTLFYSRWQRSEGRDGSGSLLDVLHSLFPKDNIGRT